MEFFLPLIPWIEILRNESNESNLYPPARSHSIDSKNTEEQSRAKRKWKMLFGMVEGKAKTKIAVACTRKPSLCSSNGKGSY